MNRKSLKKLKNDKSQWKNIGTTMFDIEEKMKKNIEEKMKKKI